MRILVAAGLILLLAHTPALSSERLTLSEARDALGKEISGDGQVGVVGDELPMPLLVSVTDENGEPVKGVLVRFSVVGEPKENLISGFRAKLQPEHGLSDSYGWVRSRVSLGGEPGSYYVVASSPRADGEVSFCLSAQSRRWKLLLLFGLFGGFAIFLFGLNFGSRALTRVGGNRLREFIWNLTSNPLLGVTVGVFVTMLTQSSSATTVLLVGFANAGLMTLSQTLGVILGADIGTTVTIQIIAFKVSQYSIAIVALGFLILTIARRRSWNYAGRVIFGFGLIFFGMKVMSDAVSPLKSSGTFLSLISLIGENPALGVILAALFTGVVQSSAATIGIVLMLSFQGLIDLPSAIPLVFGANIGTCVTAILGSVGRSVEAKRVALAHILFKVLVILILLPLLGSFSRLVSLTAGSTSRQIANAHSIVNVAAALLFLPLLKPYSRLVNYLVRGKEEIGRKAIYLDPQVLGSPALAIGQASREVLRMGDLSYNMLKRSIEVFKTNDEELMKALVSEDDRLDTLEEEITSYLTRVSQEELTPGDSKRGVSLLYAVDELEHIGDLVSKNLMGYARKKIKEGFYFSDEGFEEIQAFHQEVLTTLQMAIDALATSNRSLAKQVVARRAEMNQLLKDLHNAHLLRLRKGLKETMETSTVHLDLISDLERANFHATNIGYAILG